MRHQQYFVPPKTLLTSSGFDRQRIMQTAWIRAGFLAHKETELSAKLAAQPARGKLPAYGAARIVAPAQMFAQALADVWHMARIEAQRAGRVSKVRKVLSFVAEQVRLYGSAEVR